MRAFSTSTTAAPAGASTGRSTMAAAAPWAKAAGTKPWPSARAPGKATKRLPDPALRESQHSAVISVSPLPASRVWGMWLSSSDSFMARPRFLFLESVFL